ncbi:ABC transporter substrate-binding protein [Azotobacter vinelandii]
MAGGALLALLGMPGARAETRRTLSYYGGQLRLPERITRIATAWEAQNAVIAMLGHGQDIVASTRIVRQMPVFRRFVPSIADAALASGGGANDVNVEELLRVRPELLFVAGSLPPAKRKVLEGAGIAIVELRANSLDALLERVRISGEILGPQAQEKARDYQAYFQDNVARVRRALEGVPAEKNAGASTTAWAIRSALPGVPR